MERKTGLFAIALTGVVWGQWSIESAEAAAIRFRPVAATGNVVCMPGEGACGETEIVLSDGGVEVTLFVEVSGWDYDLEFGQCTERSCTKSGVMCYSSVQCDVGICTDGSQCSVSASDCPDGSPCLLDENCRFASCWLDDPTACDSGRIGQCAPWPTLGAFQVHVDSDTYIGGHPSGSGTKVGLDLSPVGYPDNGFLAAFQALSVCANQAPPDMSDPVTLLSDCGDNVGSTACPMSHPYCLDRPDYVFYGGYHVPIVSTSVLDYSWAAAVAHNCAVDPDGGETWFYGGTLKLNVPAGTSGTYRVTPDADPNFTILNVCLGWTLVGPSRIPAEISIAGACCMPDWSCDSLAFGTCGHFGGLYSESTCDRDRDDDGVADACDPCPLDFLDDRDGDGVCDSDDGCPNNPDKFAPGVCGCLTSDDDPKCLKQLYGH